MINCRKNVVLQLFPAKNVGDQTYAILETPCYPASYYFGPVHFTRDGRTGEWDTANNATSNWHKTLQGAKQVAIKQFPNVWKTL